MNPTFASFKQQRTDQVLKNTTNNLNKQIAPKTFQEIRDTKFRSFRENKNENILIKPIPIVSKFNQITNIMKKCNSQISFFQQSGNKDRKSNGHHNIKHKNIVQFHTGKKQVERSSRPYIHGPSIIRNKSFMETQQINQPKHRQRPSKVDERICGLKLNFQTSKMSEDVGRFSETYSRSIQSSFGENSSQDYSCFNTSGINQKDQFEQVKDRSLQNVNFNQKNLLLAESFQNTKSIKQLQFSESSFGNVSIPNQQATMKSLNNNYLDNSICGSQNMRNSVAICDYSSNIKTENSTFFTKKMKHSRQNKSQFLQSSLLDSSINSLTPSRRSFIAPQNSPPPQLSLSQFNLVRQIGQGKYGKVYLTLHRPSNFVCALKIISKLLIKQQNLQEPFIHELKIQMYLNHPNIVKLYGFFSDSDNFYLIMEYCHNGHLLQTIKNKQSFQEKEIKQVLIDVFEAVSYIHGHGVIHRDLKPENIVIQQGAYKICDFGWAAYAGLDRRTTFCGTPLYVSPEVLKGEEYDAKTDIWGLGILAYQLSYGRADMLKIVKDPVYYPSWSSISPILQNLIKLMLNKIADDRPSLNEILASSFFSGYNWMDLSLRKELQLLF